MTDPTHIGQSRSAPPSRSINHTLNVYPPDSDGDICIEIKEGDSGAWIYLDAAGVSALQQALSAPTEAAPPAEEPFALDWNQTAISAAIHFERSIEFAYDKGEGVIEQRKLFPKVSYDAPNGIVAGDDPDRNDVRAFRLDRIQGEVVIR